MELKVDVASSPGYPDTLATLLSFEVEDGLVSYRTLFFYISDPDEGVTYSLRRE